MSDAAKPESPVTASPPLAATSIKRFPGSEGDAVSGSPGDRGDDLAYRPLSSLSIVAFGIAAIYAAVIVIGALVAAFMKMPWLIGGWTLVFPVIAVVVAVLGWMQVQMSEGTRTGKQLAVWAITLSIVVSLGYWAYYAATYFVIRGQAQAFARQYFDKINEGKLESAFLMAVPPRARPREDASLRDMIENRLNVDPGQGQPGGSYFNMFKEHLSTHLIIQGGPDTRIEPLGVSSWEFQGGGQGYVVKERYRISTPELSYEGVVVLRSAEPQGKEQKGRQWFVALNEMPSELTGLSPTEEGLKLLMLQRSAANFLRSWHEQLVTMQKAKHAECYLATLDPAERGKVRAQIATVVGTTITAGAGEAWNSFAMRGAAALATEDYLPGYAAFTRGELLKLDADFWAPSDQLRARTLPACRQVFQTTTSKPRGMIKTDPNKIGYWSVDTDRVRFRHAVQFQLLSLAEVVEGVIFVECPASVLVDGPTAESWRITGMNLTNVRVQPRMDQPGPGSPPTLGGPGMGP